jgi:EF-P beta-lysylation protein EpmB
MIAKLAPPLKHLDEDASLALVTDPSVPGIGAGLPASGFPAEILWAFPFRVSRSFLARAVHGDPADPLWLQFAPQAREADPTGSKDPLGERQRLPSPRLIRKYAGRALLLASTECSIHCRYCFRRHFPVRAQAREDPDCEAAVALLAGDPSIREVILSGGDPLTLSPARLASLCGRLNGLAHLATLRVHSREPVVRPGRIGPELLAALGRFARRRVLVIHANHAREITPAVVRALQAFRTEGFHLLNQSVLLAGVNDDPGSLADLSESLFSAGVLPYYLHQLDPVQGGTHFAVADDRACAIHQELRTRLPGYLVPRLVREVPGAPAKTPLEG